MVSFKSVMRMPVKAVAALCTLALCTAMAACSDSSASSDSSSSSSVGSTDQLAGITATGDLGKEPTISFHTPMTVEDGASAVLQEGDGAVIKEGDLVCFQGKALQAKDGSELMNTWTNNTPSCTPMTKDTTNSTYYNLIIGKKVNTTIAFGVNDNNTSGTSYIMVLTLISTGTVPTRAEGTAVTDIPSDLPKVTLDDSGKPSLDLNGYTPGDQLVSQTLIKGSGREVQSTDSLTVQYTGWCIGSDGTLTQFDSSWDRGSASSFSLSQVIKGWTNGLTGQTIGSQVLLIVPPDQGYGSTAQEKIPANSTLYFIVDILYAS